MASTDKKNTKAANNKNSKQKEQEQVAKFKSELRKLYSDLEKYFVMNIFYEKLSIPNPNPVAEILLSRIKPYQEVAEIGLNPGSLTLEACLKEARAVGVDSSPMKVVVAENLKHIAYDKFSLMQKEDNLNIPIDNLLSCKYKVMDFTCLDFNDSILDIIFSDCGINEGNINSILKEFKRVLSMHGELILKFTIDKNLLVSYVNDKENTLTVPLTSYALERWASNNKMEVRNRKISYKSKLLKPLALLIKKMKMNQLLFHFEKTVTMHIVKP